MTTPEKAVATTRGFRVNLDTLRRRFLVLLALSITLHLVLTPMASWVGFVSRLFPAEQAAPPPVEELDAIPIELLESDEQPEAAPEGEVPKLPEDDPIEMIEELLDAPEPVAQPASTPPAPTSKPEEKPEAEDEDTEREADAGTPPVAKEPEPEPVPPEETPAPLPPAAEDTQPQDAGVPQTEQPPQETDPSIGDPVALAGKASKMVESNAKLSLILYAEQIREHPVGQRIGKILPKLPQWRDFFGDASLDAVRDFDRFFMAGPSFYYSDQVVVVLQHNTKGDQVKQAIDRLVKRKGRWLEGTRVPAALAFADRAERLFVLPSEKLVMVVPPKLQKQALSATGLSIPRGKGEALVATVSKPSKSFWQLGLDIPESVHDAKIRISALSQGRVKIELSALEDSEEGAHATAHQLSRSINSMVDGLRGLSNALDWIGFGGMTRGAKLPRVNLRAKGVEIRGEVTLTEEQANFILDRVENQVVRQPVSAKPAQPQRTKASDSSATRKPGGAAPGKAQEKKPKRSKSPQTDNSTAAPKSNGTRPPSAGTD